MAVSRGFSHRRGHRTGDARAWNGAPRCRELTAAACQRAAGGQRRLRHGGAGARRNLGLAGFFLSLGPSLAAKLLHSNNLLWGGILIFLLTGLAATASTLLARKNPSTVMLGGCLLLTWSLGDVRPDRDRHRSRPVRRTAIAGLGFGPAFMGAYRATVAAATSHDRAGLITAIYIVSYLATGIPAVLAGIATSHYGLHKTALVYWLGSRPWPRPQSAAS